VRAQKGTAVALFDESLDIEPRRRPPLRRSSRIGFAALAVALVILAALSFLPTGYVIQQPGPVYNTLGTAATGEGDEVPLISIEGAETFETTGSLDLTTVQVVGNRERTPSWIELVGAWFDSSRAVVPIASVFPAGQTSEQRNEESAQMMVDSQQEATAAALTAQGIDVGARVRVFSLPEDSPAEGVLEADDIIVAAEGEPVDDVERLREIVQRGEGDPVALTVERGGQTEQVEILPEFSEDADAWQVGVSIIHDYDFPVDVTIQLDNVGGPSAGMMFALGIIDTMTPGELTGGLDIAGTGTIDADGVVGPIGGIRQKLYGARGAGAEYFLAPAANCDEVEGHIPSGLQVFAVETLDDSLAALETLREGGDLDALPACTAG
jgi:PDZ domain-containing protein